MKIGTLMKNEKPLSRYYCMRFLILDSGRLAKQNPDSYQKE
jgi:hypothetical protein